jgi:hypothetical protein
MTPSSKVLKVTSVNLKPNLSLTDLTIHQGRYAHFAHFGRLRMKPDLHVQRNKSDYSTCPHLVEHAGEE